MDRGTSITVGAVIAAILLSASLGFYFATVTVAQSPRTVASSAQEQSLTVLLNVVPDWAGEGYDAFIFPENMVGSIPTPATNTTAPGPNNANITVAAGVPVTFVITDLDDMDFNFSSVVTVPYTLYNKTDSGQTAIHYSAGQRVEMTVSHTFTITSLNINIPIPPSEVVSFTYTFTKPGTYVYVCLTPCGPGMDAAGYMYGYIIVK